MYYVGWMIWIDTCYVFRDIKKWFTSSKFSHNSHIQKLISLSASGEIESKGEELIVIVALSGWETSGKALYFIYFRSAQYDFNSFPSKQ